MAAPEEVIHEPESAHADPHILDLLAASPLSGLTERQLQIVDLCSQGQSTLEIAGVFDLTRGSTVNCRSEIIKNTGAFSMAHVVRLSCDAKLFVEPLERPKNLRRPTPIRLEALDIFSYGHNERYVARELDILPRTARARRTRAVHDLGAKTFPHAVRLAWECGFIPTPS